jgi:hypothetical protein
MNGTEMASVSRVMNNNVTLLYTYGIKTDYSRPEDVIMDGGRMRKLE